MPRQPADAPRLRQMLLSGTSAMVLGLVVAAPVAQAQTARMAGVLGAMTVPTTGAQTAAVPQRSVRMQQALAQQQANRDAVKAMRTMVTDVRNALLASVRNKPTDGLSLGGLNPAVTAPVKAADDASGRATWEGALMPTEVQSGNDYTVTIKQTDQRALLSWNSFDVGANTTLVFDQKLNGKAQTDWVALNRVVDPKASPTTILGKIKADGKVLILNRNGVIFGQGSQINVNSLLASSLEIGNFGKELPVGTPGSDLLFTGLSLAERNRSFLDDGLLVASKAPTKFDALLTSSLAGSGTYVYTDAASSFSSVPEGNVVIDRGASITAGDGGFLIFTAPNLSNDGTLTATNGQISLQAGRAISYTTSTGASNSADPDIRGLILRSPIETGGEVVNSGLIDAKRGYVSLGADLTGSVSNLGLISDTTSVSRNGVVSLTAGHILIGGGADTAHAGGISIQPDDNGETVPQGTADEPPLFKTSRIDIGGAYVSPVAGTSTSGVFGTANVEFGENALIYAPSAVVSVGGRADQPFDLAAYAAVNKVPLAGDVVVKSGARIDVSGVKDVQLEASRNIVTISPLKGNELRDTPNYRDVLTNGGFTLNGQTVSVDPRRSGVRADGVKWVGSPLIEAGSAISQIGVDAAELMTKGGTVTLLAKPVIDVAEAAHPARVIIESGAKIDFSGGWVHYNAGRIETTRLIRADGTIVDIADADPNGDYVGIADGFSSVQSKFGTSRTFTSRLLSGSRDDPAYDEGRDAGGLTITASTATVEGSFAGDAFAGQFQLSKGQIGSKVSAIARDPRNLQASPYELPSAGFLRVGSFSGKSAVDLGGDILVRGVSAPTDAAPGTIILSDAQINDAHLAAVTLQTSGGVRFAADSAVTLVDGGKLTVNAGRTILLDGNITAKSGTITAGTSELLGTVLTSPIAAAGSAFTTDDDVQASYAQDAVLARPFDVRVGGTLDVSGVWSNDYLAAQSNLLPTGTAYTSGGSISLLVAPKVFVYSGGTSATAKYAADLSGSIVIGSDALLNVSSGGHVAQNGLLDLVAKGGNVSLINQTIYASVTRTDSGYNESSLTDQAVGAATQSVTYTPIPSNGILPAIRSSAVPVEQRSSVQFSASNFKGFSFGGGGSFTLVAPSVSFGSDTAAGSAHVDLDFLQKTGFGTLDVSSYRSRLFKNLFDNGVEGNSAFLDTTLFRIGAGETLNLNQALMPVYLDASGTSALQALATGSDVAALLQAAVPTEAFDQRAATLKLGGMIELDVEKDGSIIGGAGATIITPKLLNQGRIRLVGGSITQRSVLPESLVGGAIGVRGEELGGLGLGEVLGAFTLVDGHKQYSENANALVQIDGETVTNGQLFSRPNKDRAVYFLGKLGADEGIRLEAGSTTDLSGGVVFNPRAPILADGRMQRTGLLYGGGSIGTSAAFTNASAGLYTPGDYSGGREKVYRGGESSLVVAPVAGLAFNAATGSVLDVSGSKAAFDIAISGSDYALTPQWSNAGAVRVLAGGSLAAGTVRAFGGTDQAEGGVLEWVNPILRQSVGGGAAAAGVVSADWVEASGFATMIARGKLGLDGTVDLRLGKAFILSSIDPTTSTVNEPELRTSVSLLSNGDAAISAPYIRLSSRSQQTLSSPTTAADKGSVTFSAKSLDLVGGITFIVPTGKSESAAAGAVNLKADHDIRLIGVAAPFPETAPSGITGAVVSTGDLRFTADQVYTTTGTGNLQQLIEDRRNGTSLSTARPFLLGSLAADGTVGFSSNGGAAPKAPYSAGSWLRVAGAHIEQDGVLRVPLGLLEIGNASPLSSNSGLLPATQSVHFGAGSVTSVSGEGLNVPYGQTTDLTEYYFKPNVNGPLTAAPVGEMRLEGQDIAIQGGAKIDGRGGGDIFAYEFVSGTGGSRDVLSRENTDTFSSNNGLQFEDGRQVYAIVPVSQAGEVAAFDPLYSASYGAGGGDLYGTAAGRTVWLDGGNGIAAGEYLLLPAHYALLPGALRLVENTDSAAPFVTGSTKLLDGSVVVGGSYATTGTDYRESVRRSFTVQSAATFGRYSRIQTTSGTTNFSNQAKNDGKVAPRTPLDAARFVISPSRSFTVDGTFVTDVATGGRGAQFDIAASVVQIRDSLPAVSDPGTLVLTTSTLSALNANSLLIGGVRSDNVDGTTRIDVQARDVSVGRNVALTLPELILVAGGSDSRVSVAAGASIKTAGTLADQLLGDYIVGYQDKGPATTRSDNSGIGSLLRISTGPERLVRRITDPALGNADLAGATLTIAGGATVSANTIALDTSGRVRFDEQASIEAKSVSLGSTRIDFSDGGIGSVVANKLAAADNLTLRSRRAITLGGALPDRFNNLVIDAPGLLSGGGDSLINAKSVKLRNSVAALADCSKNGAAACGSTNKLTIRADEIALGSGDFRVVGYEGGVLLDASKGVFVEGKGAFVLDDASATSGAALTIKAPLVADRAPGGTIDYTSGGADYAFLTRGRVTIDGTGRTGDASAAAGLAGSLIAFGSADAHVASLTLNNSQIRATSGVVNAFARNAITVSGNASIAVPGFTTKVGSNTDPLVVTAGSGTISLQSSRGDITLAQGTSLIVDNGIGGAGTLQLAATNGTIRLGSALNGGVKAGTSRDASLHINGGNVLGAQDKPFDLTAFLADNGRLFEGDFDLRTGTGNLDLAAGTVLRADSVRLVADNGTVTIGGTIDTSGDSVAGLKLTDPAYRALRVNGGDIAVYGKDGVALAGTARILAGTSGYSALDSRQAHGGNVMLGVAADTASISIASGARIDVSAQRPGDRLVAITVKDADTLALTTAYRHVYGDLGGTVTLRAPVIDNDTTVDIRNSGTIVGAREQTIDAFKHFDLDAIAASGAFSGVTRDADGIHLDAAATGKPNLLADTTATGTLPSFIRNFSLKLKNGGSLAGFRVRPEVELSSKGTILVDSNINLAAGTLVDYAGALADGLLVASPLGPDANGNPRYEVVQGKEGQLFAKYIDMTFRVGGKATGEAGIFTVRAGGDLKVSNSISDGFFAFHDRTNADYLNYQLGGGNRQYHPAIQLNCADFSTCDNTLPLFSKYQNRRLDDADIVVVDLTSPELGGQATPIFVHSPYTASANSVAADGTGNGIGVADLFPLVDGKPVRSSDIRLAAGAEGASADPVAVDPTKRGSVIVAGEKSYLLKPKAGDTSLGGGVQFGFDDGSGTIVYDTTGNFFNGAFSSLVDPTTAADLYTRLNWGADTDLADTTRTAALSFFAGRRFIREDGVVTGVYASLAEVNAFLSGSYGADFTRLNAENIDLSSIDVPQTFDQPRVFYRPVVRTGDGNIAVAAGKDISLVASGAITYRDETGASRDEGGAFGDDAGTAQVGGAAIYTAGTRLSTIGLTGTITQPDQTEILNYIPSPQGLLDSAPNYTGGGGSVTLSAGNDVLARRDVWSEVYLNGGIELTTTLPGLAGETTTFNNLRLGNRSQRWRTGNVGNNTQITLIPQMFSSGVGALAGGDVTIRAGRDVSDLTVALVNSVVTDRTADGAQVLVSSGSGNLDFVAGRDVFGGQVDIAQGAASINVGRQVTDAGSTANTGAYDTSLASNDQRSLLRLRVADAAVTLTARGSVTLGGIGALGAQRTVASISDRLGSAGFFSPMAGVSVATVGAITLAPNRNDLRTSFTAQEASAGLLPLFGYVLPPSLSLTSLGSDVALTGVNPNLLYPSRFGQLSLVAGGNLSNFALSMSDANPSDLPGAFTAAKYLTVSGGIPLRVSGLGFTFGGTIGEPDDAVQRLIHDRNITHIDDDRPALIYAGGSMSNVQLSLPKAARINAGLDLVNFYFEGQNLRPTDVTSIVAGRDILATTTLPDLISPVSGRPYVGLTNFVLGGPGALSVQAGRNLGPFLNSVTVNNVSYAGGIRTIGNEANPWLGTTGADLYALYGVAFGADYTALRDTYLDPANLAKLDGDLFAQNADTAGNLSPDRKRPIYGPVLARWMRDNAADAFAAVFGSADVSTDAKLSAQAWAKYDALYAAFKGTVSEEQQRQFLLGSLYFGELAAPARPDSNSFNQYVRGYRVIQTLFPAKLGYTDNLSTFETDPASVTADHPLGEPTKKLVNGEAAVAARVQTGNVDLRLATIGTSRGGSITLIGPGGDFIAGSVVRTSTQAASKSTLLGDSGRLAIANGLSLGSNPVGIDSIPIGFEGVLSLRGGAIRSFSDGSFRLNQSRLFTLSGGDVTMWSSNGDLNAGQGPKTASNFPPVTLRFSNNATGELNSAGSVAGAGIAALRPTPDVPSSSVILVAPVGTVDAGDAGVRASGDVFVAAARVANADNFKVGGVSVGVPTTAIVAAPSVPAGATAATAATAAQAKAQESKTTDRRSIIRVDVLGFIGGNADDCPSGRFDSSGKCVR